MVQYNRTPPRHQPPRLLEQVRVAIRTKHYSLRTEDTYVQWIRRFILFQRKRHPADWGVTRCHSPARSKSVTRVRPPP